MRDVVVEVRGGVLVEIYTGDPDIRVTVVDWDRADGAAGNSAGVQWNPVGLAQMPADTNAEYSKANCDLRADDHILAAVVRS